MRRLLRTAVIASASVFVLVGCGSEGDGTRAGDDSTPRYVRDQVLLVPMGAGSEDVEQVELALRTVVPGATVQTADPITPPRTYGEAVDGRAAIDKLLKAHPTAGGPVMVLGLTSDEMVDTTTDTRFAFLVRDRPQAVLSTFRLRGQSPGLAHDRMVKLVARLVGTVYFRVDDIAVMREIDGHGPFGRLDSLADLDAMDGDLCERADPLDSAEEWNTDENYREQTGCPPAEEHVEPHEYPDRVASAFQECRDATDDDRDCFDLAELVREEPTLGPFVDRAARITGASCVDDCVFALQRDGDGLPVIRSWVWDSGQSSLHTFRADTELHDRTCVGDVGPTCPAEEPACVDASMLAWVQRAPTADRRGPIPASVKLPARC